MRRIYTVACVLLLVASVSVSRAQSYFTSVEVGVALGGSQYFGDLNEHYGFRTIGMAGGVYVRKHMNHYISVKALANYTKVGYDDKYNTDPYDRARNLNFQSAIVEVALQAEFNFFSFVTGDKNHRYTPFLTGGIGGFYYNPYTFYNGTRYYLRPLGTEGENAGIENKYNNYSVCFPVGVGGKCWLKGGVNLTVEIADRLTATDYLDDVSTTYAGANTFPPNSVARALQDRSAEVSSTPLGRSGKQRGNTSSFDQYLMALVSISWHFTTYRCPSFMLNEDLIRVR